MLDCIPPEYCYLFDPRSPPEYIAPLKQPRKHGAYVGLSAYLDQFESPAAAAAARAAKEAADAARPAQPTIRERHEMAKRKREEANAEKIRRQKAAWDPHALQEEVDGVTRDPYSTLFVGRLVCCSVTPYATCTICVTHSSPSFSLFYPPFAWDDRTIPRTRWGLRASWGCMGPFGRCD